MRRPWRKRSLIALFSGSIGIGITAIVILTLGLLLRFTSIHTVPGSWGSAIWGLGRKILIIGLTVIISVPRLVHALEHFFFARHVFFDISLVILARFA